jgi:DNA helicase II / ATP-dependent DNA helicase PcrA
VGGRIETLRQDGHRLAEIAVLVRAGFQTRAFEERLITLAIPYRIIGGQRFYERAEIRDAIAYLRLIVQPADDLAFERIVNLPRRGVGDAAMRSLYTYSRAQGVPLMLAAERLIASGELRGRVRENLAELLQNFIGWRDLLQREGHVVTAATMLDESGYTAMWKADKSPEAPGRLDNLKELVRALADFDTLAAFLDHVSLVMENEESHETDRVSLMTLHGAKGLEFDTVFLPGWEEGLFPSQRSMEENGLKGLEEERRLAYVGLTRARLRAIISHAANRRIYANWQSNVPSRFIEELPPEHISQTGAARLDREQRLAAPPVFSGAFAVTASRPRQAPGPWEQASRPPRTDSIPVGARVFHQKFGYGTVMAVDDNRLDIAFEQSGEKRVLDTFVERA